MLSCGTRGDKMGEVPWPAKAAESAEVDEVDALAKRVFQNQNNAEKIGRMSAKCFNRIVELTMAAFLDGKTSVDFGPERARLASKKTEAPGTGADVGDGHETTKRSIPHVAEDVCGRAIEVLRDLQLSSLYKANAVTDDLTGAIA